MCLCACAQNQTRMHSEGLWCVCVSEPSKGRGDGEHGSSSINGSSIANVRVSGHVCVSGGGERRGRHDRTPGRRGGSREANPASLLRCRRSGNRGRYSPERLEPWMHGGSLFYSVGGLLLEP